MSFMHDDSCAMSSNDIIKYPMHINNIMNAIEIQRHENYEIIHLRLNGNNEILFL